MNKHEAVPTETRTESSAAGDAAVGHRIPAFAPLDERRFEIGDERARGGVGRILEANDRLLGRRVALKLPHAQHRPEHVARFMREALITARLQHPAIVPVYDAAVCASGEPCYSMRLVPGATLRDAIAAARGLEDRLALLPHVQTVADAVAYAHEQGIVHRDLKPSNVLVGPFGETVVIDWGLAKDVREGALGSLPLPDLQGSGLGSDLTRTGTVLGTPGYMPPEQARGEEVDARADVFAIGAVLYQLLTGSAPYPDGRHAAVLEGPPPPVETREPSVPADLAAIVAQAMAPDPGARYQTAQALSRDLRRFSTGQLVGARRYSRWALARRWLGRHRTAALSALLVLATLVAGTVGIVRERNRTAAENNRLRLMQAQAVLDSDPTAAAAWLKTYVIERGQDRHAVDVAAHAAAAGVARHVLTLPGDVPLRVCLADSGRLAGVLGREGAIWLFDLQRGTRRRLGTVGGPPLGCLFSAQEKYLVGYATRGGGLMAARLPDGQAVRLPVPGNGFSWVRLASGGRLVITGNDGTIHLANVDGTATRALSNLPHGLVFSVPAPAEACLYGGDGQGGLWRIPIDGSPATLLERLDSPLYRIGFSPDGRQMVFASRQNVGVRDLATGRTRWVQAQANPGTPINVVATRRGVIFIADDDGAVTWWNPDTDERVKLGTGAFFKFLAVTADGERATWIDLRGKIFIADLEGQTVHTLIGHHTALRSYQLTADGRWLATTHGNAVRIFALPAPTGRRLALGQGAPLARSVPGRAQMVTTVDGRRLVAFDARTGARRLLADVGEKVVGLAVSPGGRWIGAVGVKGRVLAVDFESGSPRELHRVAGADNRIAFVDDDTLIATDETGLRRWDLVRGEGRLVTRFPGPLAALTGIAGGGAPTGRPQALAVSGSFRNMVLVDLEDGRQTPMNLAGGAQFEHAVANDRRRIAAGLTDGRVLLWQIGQREGRLLGRLDGFISGMGFSADDRLLFVADETGLVARYDLASGLASQLGHHGARIRDLSISPSGRWLATADATGEIRLWEPRAGGLRVWRGMGDTSSVQFLGEDWLVSADEKGAVHVLAVDAERLVPAPPGLTPWLEALTSARLDGSGAVASPSE
jgi:eukaryotic-like serine/threonine-protein kinase